MLSPVPVGDLAEALQTTGEYCNVVVAEEDLDGVQFGDGPLSEEEKKSKVRSMLTMLRDSVDIGESWRQDSLGLDLV